MANTPTLDDILDEYFDSGEGWNGNGKQALLQWVADEVVGIDWTYAKLPTTQEAEHRAYDAKIANRVLNQQRSTLREHGWKEPS